MSLPATLGDLVADLEAAQAQAPADNGDFMYMKMSKAGEWLYGADETEISNDSLFIIDPASYMQGFVAWDDGELHAEHMSVAGEKPVLKADLPALPAGAVWDTQVGFCLKGIEGPEDNLQLVYKVSSRGGKKAVSALLKQIIERGRAGKADLCPVVELKSDSYKHKKYGKIYTPELRVLEWDDVPEAGEEVAAVEVEAAAEPEVEVIEEAVIVEEVVAEAEPPRRRRRRK